VLFNSCGWKNFASEIYAKPLRLNLWVSPFLEVALVAHGSHFAVFLWEMLYNPGAVGQCWFFFPPSNTVGLFLLAVCDECSLLLCCICWPGAGFVVFGASMICYFVWGYGHGMSLMWGNIFSSIAVFFFFHPGIVSLAEAVVFPSWFGPHWHGPKVFYYCPLRMRQHAAHPR